MYNSHTSNCQTKAHTHIICTWPHKMKNYSGQKKGSNKKGIVFPLMGSACEGETVHSSAAKDSICMSRILFICPSNSGSLRSGEPIVMLECNSKQIRLTGSNLCTKSDQWGHVWSQKYQQYLNTGTLGEVKDNTIFVILQSSACSSSSS